MAKTVRKLPLRPPAPSGRKRVAAYARVSSGKDAMLHSLSAQVSYYNAYIQRHADWQFAGIYADEALTGTKDARPEFQRLLTDCRDGKIDMVVTKSISRFARNTLTLLEAVRELKALGIDVFFEEQNMHTISGEGEMILALLASVAQEESRSTSENCKWYCRQRMKAGYIVGLRFMFGYNIDRGRITVNEREAAIVRWVFSEYINGASTTGIARTLEAEEAPSINGGRWTAKRIRDMLKNEKYTGDALMQKKYVADHLTKRLVRNRGELAQYYLEGTHEGLIDACTFAQAQERMKRNAEKTNVKKPSTTRYPFSSMIVCCNCAKHYSRKITRGRISWQCATFLRDGKSVCPAKQIPEPALMSLVNGALGLKDFDEQIFKERVKELRVTAPNEVTIVFKDGHTELHIWQDRSRRESWTEEMRQQARERSLEHGRSAK